MAESSGKRGFDLDGMSVAELTALRDAAEAKRLEKLEDAKAAVIERARAEIEQLGLSFESVFMNVPSSRPEPSRRTRKDAGEPVPVKFRGPNGETWSGRGRMPKWLQALEAEGKSRDEYAVEKLKA
ncbi:MAG TPA: H-NS histone family protein [Falsiroseomonas sp.]|jgi:DNA-binding protein H-NS|nr:H-NS histone family protein [Falsiroseomonas sp.]